ncbi:hypothetical protein Pmani_009984 [Petrolisthes manimaculis]|uniref:Uncharacterized protein n=1 Tax=Petrolisthes manimaculis TaxID=1843537 RepID=A0AAE1Q5C9_9EUCA|nr:hypothetical protein Pmani_009984 [Petrolisthes manimaculis]
MNSTVDEKLELVKSWEMSGCLCGLDVHLIVTWREEDKSEAPAYVHGFTFQHLPHQSPTCPYPTPPFTAPLNLHHVIPLHPAPPHPMHSPFTIRATHHLTPPRPTAQF